MKQRSSILLFSSFCQENDEREVLRGTSTFKEEAMTFEYDEKGKIFTDIVSKNSINATVQTTTHLIRGHIHVRRDQRIKDELDLNESFLAMTDVSVMGPDGQTLFQAPFLAVRRSHIIWVLPEQSQSAEGLS
ncbi:MAG TPA: hypothetical protein VJ821_19190 [Anaerolineales bacterium]|nr:hypothetical protein [Anaerolineales bacterium]